MTLPNSHRGPAADAASAQVRSLSESLIDAAPLVGRDEEFRAVLAAALAPGSVVVVEGEAGVGKSRLVSEVLASPQLERHATAVAWCSPLLSTFPFGPILEALRGLAGRIGSGLDPVAGALGPLLPELVGVLPDASVALLDPAAERHRMFRAVAAVLEHVAPLVLVVEDLHWADASTMDLLRYLCARRPAGVTLVTTFRREGVPSDLVDALLSPATGRRGAVRGRQVRLMTLTPQDVGAMAAGMLGEDAVSAEFARYLHGRTAGIPFAVEEVLRLLHDRHDVVRHGDHWVRKTIDELPVPDAVAESVRARVSRLSPEGRAVVEAAAVAGRAYPGGVLLDIAGIDPARGALALDETTRARLVVSFDGRFDVRHALARDAVYSGLSEPSRVLLHDRAATVLAGQQVPHAELVRHLRRAGRIEEWVASTAAAGDAALAAGNHAVAVQLLREFLNDPAAPQEVHGVMAVKLGRAAVDGGGHAEAIGVIRRCLVQPASSADVRGELRLELGRLLHRAGEPEQALEEFIRAADAAEHPPLRARAMASVAFAGMTAGRLLQYMDWLERAWDLARDLDDVVVKTAVAVDRVTLLVVAGDPRARDALASVPPATEQWEVRREHLRLRRNAASSALRTGEYRWAADLLRELEDTAAEVPWAQDALTAERLLLDWYTGHWEGLEARADAHVPATPDSVADRELVVAKLALVRHRPGATRALQELFTRPSAIIQTDAAAFAGGALIRSWLSRGRKDEAVAAADRLRTLLERDGTWLPLGDCGVDIVFAYLAADRRGVAEEFLADAQQALATRQAPAALAALGHAQGVLAWAAGDLDRADRLLRDAADAWRCLPRPYDAVLADEHRGLVWLSGCDALSSDRSEAVASLLACVDAFQALGATWDVNRLQRRLREEDVVTPSRRGRKSYGGELSPREAQVFALAAAGKTNRDIAAELFLSPRTVSDHVVRAMRKLGVQSRRDLRVDGGERSTSPSPGEPSTG